MSLVLSEVRPVGRGMLAAPTGRGAPKNDFERLLERRTKILVTIAERYGELVDPLGGPSGLRGDGEAVGLMPRTYTPTVREFERLVGRLREERHSKWWHLNAFWLAAESRTVFHCHRCGPCPGAGETHKPTCEHPSRKRAGKKITVTCKRVVVWRRHRNADRAKALKALEWVAAEWRLSAEPMLPEEIRRVA